MKFERVHICLVVVLFFLCHTLIAQSNWNEWQKGTVYLSNGKSLSGDVIYEEGLASLLFTSGPGGEYILDEWRQGR